MRELRKKNIIIFTSFMIVIGWGVGLLLNNVLISYNPSNYYLIPIFFYIIGMFLIYSITIKPKKNEEKKLVNKYMLLRVVKVLLSLFLLLLYWLINKEGIKNFAIVFILFYMIYLIFETFVYLQVEKKLKLENKKQ